jgi:maltooligosyltrehalose synthase
VAQFHHEVPADNRPRHGKGRGGHGLLRVQRLVSLNEVGGSPDRFGTSPDTFTVRISSA